MKGHKPGRQPALPLIAWAIACVIAGSALTAFHQPFQSTGAAVAGLSGSFGGGENRWRVADVLSTSCGCSARVLQHLLERGPLPGLTENVVIAGEDSGTAGFGESTGLERLGFRVERIKGLDPLARYGVRGVPLFIVFEPGGRPVYSGGYGMGGYRDRAIWDEIRKGGKPPALPVYGCAASERTRRLSDPFGWKYLTGKGI